MSELVKGIEQRPLYIASTRLNGTWYYGGYNVFYRRGLHTAEIDHGVSYTYDNVLKLWSVSGTAESVSTHLLLDDEVIPYDATQERIFQGHTYKLSVDSFSSGDIIPIRISFYNSTGADFFVDYLTGPKNNNLLSISDTEITIPVDCTRIRVEFLVESGASVNSQIAYTLVDNYDGRLTTFQYGDTYEILIDGGSGFGDIHREVVNITGSGEFREGVQNIFEFTSPGVVWVKFYKDAYHSVSEDIYFQSSKVLVLELTLNQRQITVRVIDQYIAGKDKLVMNIGTPVPDNGELQTEYTELQYEGIQPGDSWQQRPSVYFVYSSNDFYRNDIVNQFNNDTLVINGIKYVANSDGSWTITGSLPPDSSSTYDLVVSISELPQYIKSRHQFEIRRNQLPSDIENHVLLCIDWYKSNEKYDSLQFISTTETITVPANVDGVRIYFLVLGEIDTTLYTSSDITFTYHMTDLSDRAVDIMKPGEYPVAAKPGIPPDANITDPTKRRYDQHVQYKSTKLVYVNLKSYDIYPYIFDNQLSITSWNLSENDMGKVYANYVGAKPYTEILITVTAYAGNMFFDAWGQDDDHKWGSTYTVPSADPMIFWDRLWDIGDVVSIGDTSSDELGLRIIDSYNQLVPYQRVPSTAVVDPKGRLRQCSYRTIMPVSDINIYVKLKSIGTSTQKGYPDYPYKDVGYPGAENGYHFPSGQTYDVRLMDEEYHEALLFCRYARQLYVDELDATPLMQGVSSDKFYPSVIVDGHSYIRHDLTRGQAVDVISRISHRPSFNEAMTNFDYFNYPDMYFLKQCSDINTPDDRIYGYAGYPSESGQAVPTTSVSTFNPYIQDLVTTSQDEQGHFVKVTDDFNNNKNLIPIVAWGTWIGATNGFNSTSYGPNTYATFEQIATMLWRYAKFRQFDVSTSGYSYDESDASSWAKNGPLQWIIEKKICTGYHVRYNGDTVYRMMKPGDNVDRVEFAYMVMKFCQYYAW